MNIAIFNSYPYHYEVFGFFIYYCFINRFNLTIFTTLDNNFGWIDFYYLYFKEKDYYYKIRDYKELSSELIYFMDKVIIITDDDQNFPKILFLKNQDKFIHITHKMKRLQNNIIPIFPFDGLDIYQNYVIPVFPIDLGPTGFKKKTDGRFRILMIGDAYMNKNYRNQHIEFIWVHRNKKNLNCIQEFTESNTFQLLNLLKQSNFLLYPDEKGHINGLSMSGLLPLAISTCTPIIFQSQRVPTIMGLKNYIIHERIDSSLIEKMKKFRYDYTQHAQIRQKILLYNFKNLNAHFPIERIKNLSSHYKGWIHFVWISDDPSEIIPKRYLPNIQTFKNINPQAKIKIWNKGDILKLLTDKRYLDFFEKLSHNLHRADFSKYLIMYFFGGLYCDLDFFCIYNLYGLIHDKDIAFFFEPREHALESKYSFFISNGFLFCKGKKNKVYLEIIEDVITNFNNRIKFTDEAWKITGRLVLTELYYKGIIPKNTIYESHYILPILKRNEFSNEKLQNVHTISFVYTLWKKGHSIKDKEELDQSLEFYITHPDTYVDTSKKRLKKINFKFLFIFKFFFIFILFSIVLYFILSRAARSTVPV